MSKACKNIITTLWENAVFCWNLFRFPAVQDNLKDKLRAVPIAVNVEIVKEGRRKRQTGLVKLSPIIAASQPTLAEVNTLYHNMQILSSASGIK